MYSANVLPVGKCSLMARKRVFWELLTVWIYSVFLSSDNLRKGAALNAIQIAEVLINRKLIKAKQKAA